MEVRNIQNRLSSTTKQNMKSVDEVNDNKYMTIMEASIPNAKYR